MAQVKAAAKVHWQILCDIGLGKLVRWGGVKRQTRALVHQESSRVCGETLKVQVDMLFYYVIFFKTLLLMFLF